MDGLAITPNRVRSAFEKLLVRSRDYGPVIVARKEVGVAGKPRPTLQDRYAAFLSFACAFVDHDITLAQRIGPSSWVLA